MWDNDDDEEVCSLYSPLLPQLGEYQYGSYSTNTAVRIMHSSPLTKNYKATLAIQISDTFYKNGKPFTEGYEIRLMSSREMFAYPLSKGIWRTFQEFCWLRKFFQKQYYNQKIPCLPPSYLFRKSYDQKVVKERIQGLRKFLQECLENKHIISDETFHLFTQTNSSIQEIKEQQPKINHADLLNMCFWACQSKSQDAGDIDYGEFKKELETVLKETENQNSFYD